MKLLRSRQPKSLAVEFDYLREGATDSETVTYTIDWDRWFHDRATVTDEVLSHLRGIKDAPLPGLPKVVAPLTDAQAETLVPPHGEPIKET